VSTCHVLCKSVVKTEHLTTDWTDVGQFLGGLPVAPCIRRHRTCRGTLSFLQPGRGLALLRGGLEQHLLQRGEWKVVRVEMFLQGLLVLLQASAGGQVQGSLWARPLLPLPCLARLLCCSARLLRLCVLGNVKACTAVLLEIHLAQQMRF